jgi:hypothetical protein
MQDTAPDYPEAVRDSTGRLCVAFAWLDLASGSWRTWQRCLHGGWELFSETWPRSGMTRNGIAFRRPPSVPLTEETGCSLLPTVGKNEFRGCSRKRFVGSPSFRGAKMSEGLRNCESDPQYLHPSFAEVVMGFPIGWTELEPAETP